MPALEPQSPSPNTGQTPQRERESGPRSCLKPSGAQQGMEVRAWPHSAFRVCLGLKFSPSWFLGLCNEGTELDDSNFFHRLGTIVTSSESEIEILNP